MCKLYFQKKCLTKQDEYILGYN